MRARSFITILGQGAVLLVMLTLAGCYQPAGSSLEATTVAQGASTYTSIPSETPFPTNTETPVPTVETTPTATDFPTVSPSPEAIFATLVITPITEVADISFAPPNQVVDELLLTATAIALQGQGGIIPESGVDIAPLQAQPDDFELSATAFIAFATQTAQFPFTQTAQAILGATPVPTQPQIIPAITPTLSGILPTAAPGVVLPVGSCEYIVQPTDPNLFRIALRFGVSVADVAQASGLTNPNLIYLNQRLIIPVVIPGCVPPGTNPPSTPAVNPAPNPGGGSGTVYIVQQGDTLFEISLQYGRTVNEIAARNGIQNINLIFIDQQITIP